MARTSSEVKIKDGLNKDVNPATKEKQDSIINLLNKAASFSTNEIFEDGSDVFLCKENNDGAWYIIRVDDNSVFSHATVKNNSTITDYANARSDVSGLTYGTFSQAF